MGEEPTSEAALDPASAIRRRIAQFGAERDPRHLIGRQADAEHAAAMTAAVRVDRAGEPEYDVATLAELARFRFLRGVVSGTVFGQVEADTAVGFFLGLRQTFPDLIPAEVADVVGSLATNAGYRLRWAVDSAGRLLALFDGTDLGAVDRAIERVLWALRTAPPDPAGRILALGRLGEAYHERHKATGDVADERKAVSARGEAVRLSPPGRDRARRLSLLADALLALYEQTGERTCLEEAIRGLEESIATTPPGDQFLWLRHNRLGRAFRHLAGTTDSPADFDAAVRWGRLARDTIDGSDTDYASALRTLDRSLRARYAKTRERADLDEAVALWRTALTRMSRDDARRVDFLVDLSDALYHRFDKEGDPADLEGSVQACESAVAEATEGSPSRVRGLSDLCYRLRRRFEHGGDLADLRRAVRVGRLAVTLISLGDGEGGMPSPSSRSPSGSGSRARSTGTSSRPGPPASPGHADPAAAGEITSGRRIGEAAVTHIERKVRARRWGPDSVPLVHQALQPIIEEGARRRAAGVTAGKAIAQEVTARRVMAQTYANLGNLEDAYDVAEALLCLATDSEYDVADEEQRGFLSRIMEPYGFLIDRMADYNASWAAELLVMAAAALQEIQQDGAKWKREIARTWTGTVFRLTEGLREAEREVLARKLMTEPTLATSVLVETVDKAETTPAWVRSLLDDREVPGEVRTRLHGTLLLHSRKGHAHSGWPELLRYRVR